MQSNLHVCHPLENSTYYSKRDCENWDNFLLEECSEFPPVSIHWGLTCWTKNRKTQIIFFRTSPAIPPPAATSWARVKPVHEARILLIGWDSTRGFVIAWQEERYWSIPTNDNSQGAGPLPSNRRYFLCFWCLPTKPTCCLSLSLLRCKPVELGEIPLANIKWGGLVTCRMRRCYWLLIRMYFQDDSWAALSFVDTTKKFPDRILDKLLLVGRLQKNVDQLWRKNVLCLGFPTCSEKASTPYLLWTDYKTEGLLTGVHSPSIQLVEYT